MAHQDDCQQAAAAEASVPCANNCGFFGNRTTMNLCSKCYRDSANMIKISPPILPSPLPPPSASLPVGQEPSSSPREESGSCRAAAPPAVVMTAVAATAPGRCSCCRRKVGLMGVKCRCGKVLCFPHRYPSEHGCEFDFQGQGRDAIAKANPVVIASKVNKI